MKNKRKAHKINVSHMLKRIEVMQITLDFKRKRSS